MVMRYYYGLGVGHTYAHVQSSTGGTSQFLVGGVEQAEGELEDSESNCDTQDLFESITEAAHDSDQLSSQEEDECWEDADEDSDRSSFSGPSSDDELYEME
jgi:hypothetical protein